LNSPQESSPVWIATLAEFLRQEQGVEAIMLNPEKRSVSLATIGQVDTAELQERLTAVLSSLHDESLKLDSTAMAPGGVVLKSVHEQTVLEKPSCPTAPRLWQWRDYSWPEPDEIEEQSSEEWKSMAVQATICGVCLLAGYLLETHSRVPSSVVQVLYVISLVSGGWDAAKDAWENMKEKRLDVHFLMLAVAAGAVAIGAWTEGGLLLFLFSASGPWSTMRCTAPTGKSMP
jgi:Cd2+/Zn2+-exporting ATPase